MTQLEKAQKRISELLDGARDEYEKVTDELNGYEIQRTAAIKDMSDAQDRTDLAAYNDARERKATAEGAIEMFKGRLDKLETLPLISDKEYKQLCDDVIKETEALAESTRGRLTDLTDQTVEIYNSYTAELNAADEALRALQVDLYRGRDLKEVRDGQILNHTVRKASTREMWGLATWAGRMKESQEYQAIIKTRGAD